MELDLRIRRPFRDPPGDGLQVVKGFAPGAGDVGHNAPPARAFKQASKSRNLAELLRADGRAGRDRVPLLLGAALISDVDDRRLEGLELLRRQEVWKNDEAIPIELRPHLCRKSVREPRAAPCGQSMCCLQPPTVKPRPIQPLGAEDRVVDEALRAGEHRREP